MKVLEGKSVFSGIAIGKISILQKVDASVKRVHVEDPEEEVKRVEAAREQAVAQLQKLYDKALQEVGESGAAIFEVHQMMLDDDDYLGFHPQHYPYRVCKCRICGCNNW